MKPTRLLIFVAIMSLIFWKHVAYGQETSPGSLIALEEKEITQIENGKEVTKTFLSDSFEEEDQIISEAKKKGRLVKVKRLKQPRIKFLNDKGDVIKEIKLSHRGEVVSEEQFKKQYPKRGEILVRRKTQRWATVSGNKKNAAVIEDINENIIPETAADEEKMLKTGGGGLSLRSVLYFYNSYGEAIWNKQTPENTGIENASISDDGKIIAYTQVFVSGELLAEEPYEKISILEMSGQEIMNFPAHSGTDVRIYADPELVMSKNGRYISARGKQNGKTVQIYIDAVNKSVWAAPKEYFAMKISDEGIAYLSHPLLKETDPKSLDLKTHLGE